jgi:nicotinamidase/pyrazinamidase
VNDVVNNQLGSGDALLIVDVQRDFCPGGALAVPEGDRVVPVLNRWIDVARRAGVPIYASRDWHPSDHCSFEPQGGPWPPHCIHDSDGARFHPNLALPAETVVINKGTERDRDALSAFSGTGLKGRLRDARVRRVFIGGLALDACVHATVLDALEEGFEVCLLLDATRALEPRRGRRRLEEMQQLGATLLEGGP